MAGSQVAEKNEGDDGRGIPIRIRNKTVFIKKVTISVTDPYATESSSDEEEIYCRGSYKERKQKPRRFERSSYFIAGNEVFSAEPSCGTRTTLSKYPGARLRPSGRWAVEVRDPFLKVRDWVGTFGTPSEASQAYLGRKYEIYRKKVAQARINANRRRSIGTSSEKSGTN